MHLGTIFRWLFAPIAALIAFIAAVYLVALLSAKTLGIPMNVTAVVSQMEAGDLRIEAVVHIALAASCIVAVAAGAMVAPPRHRRVSAVLFPAVIFGGFVLQAVSNKSGRTPQMADAVGVLVIAASCIAGWAIMRQRKPDHPALEG